MRKLIFLPWEFRAQELFPLMRSIIGKNKEIPREVEFNFSKMGFVRPSGIVFLSNFSRFLLRNGCKVKFTGHDIQVPCIKFLDDALFFSQHLGRKIASSSAPRDTTRPLIEVAHEESHNWIRQNFIPWLSKSSNVPGHDLMELATCLSELFNNISDHTDLNVGSIFAQWYPKKNKVEVCIADFGCGIPATVSSKVGRLTDDQAIIQAFEDGFSSNSTPRNRGVGLYYLRQNVVERLKGELKIHSGEGAVSFALRNDSLDTMSSAGSGLCPGTLIELEFSTNLIVPTDGEMENIEW